MHVRVLLARYRAYTLCSACDGARLNAEALRYRVGGLDLAAWHGLEVREARAPARRARRPHAGRASSRAAELVSAPRLPRAGRASATSRSIGRRARSPAARRSACRSPRRSAPRSPARCSCSTSRRSGLHAARRPAARRRASRELARRGNVGARGRARPARSSAPSDRVVELGPGAGARAAGCASTARPTELARSDGPPHRPRARRRARARPRRARTRTRADRRPRRARQQPRRRRRAPPARRARARSPARAARARARSSRRSLYRRLARALGRPTSRPPGAVRAVDGLGAPLGGWSLVDQAPLGRTSRGNAATYTKAWDRLRERFAARAGRGARGFAPGALLLQRRRRALRGLLGRGLRDGRDAVPRRRGAPLPGLPRPALQATRCSRSGTRGQRGRRRARDDRRRGARGASSDDRRIAARARGRCSELGLGYLPARPAALHALRRRGAAPQARARARRARSRARSSCSTSRARACTARTWRQVLDGAARARRRGARASSWSSTISTSIGAADWVDRSRPGRRPRRRPGGRGGHARGGRARIDDAHRRGAARASGEPPRRAAAAAARRTDGAPRHRGGARARAQPAGRLCRDPAREARGGHRAERLGQEPLAFDVVFAEGAAALPRDADALRAAVPAHPAAPGRRPRPRRSAVDRARAAHHARRRDLHRGHRHRGRALPAPALRQGRRAALPEATTRAIAASRPDEMLRALAARARARSHELLAPGGRARARARTSTSSPPRRAPGIDRGQRRRRSASRPTPRRGWRKTPRARHRSRASVRGPARGASARELVRARARAAGKGAREGARAGEGRATTLLSTERACPTLRHRRPRARSALVLLQHQAGPLRGLRGHRACEGGAGARRRESHRPVPRPATGTRLAPMPRAVRLGGRALRTRWCSSRWSRALARGAELVASPATAARVGERGAAASWCGGSSSSSGSASATSRSIARAATLSGGEMQRLRLAAQLGGGLTGALYVLDEPTIGLHPRDTGRLLDNLRALVDTGSTVLVVEHDADTHPRRGSPDRPRPARRSRRRPHRRRRARRRRCSRAEASPTGRALAARRCAALRPAAARRADWLELDGRARAQPPAAWTSRSRSAGMTVVAGVSGSGKSTLVRQVLYPGGARGARAASTPTPGAVRRARRRPRPLRRALAVDQSPIGRTPRSVPATFLGVWDELRQLFAGHPGGAGPRLRPGALLVQHAPAGGRCPACDGQGAIATRCRSCPTSSRPARPAAGRASSRRRSRCATAG